MTNIVLLRDIRKKKVKEHTLNSASILPLNELDEVSIEDLDNVVGGMSLERFEYWRVNILNESR